MEFLALAIALLLPWATGTVWLHTLQPDGSRTALVESMAYGQLAGIAILTFLMRLTSWVGVQWSFATLSSFLGVLLLIGMGVRRLTRGRLTPSGTDSGPRVDPFEWRWLAVLFCCLLAVRFGSLAYEVVLRPLYPWDAWTQWATKAKVWSALHTMAPFISYDQWLARQPGFIDTAPHYPATVPLLQAWVALALGRFDDALVNLPWLAIYVALGAGIYAQLRGMRIGATWSLFVAYMCLSLPLLDTHVALAGYADLPVAAAFTLGLLALMRWEDERKVGQLAYLCLAILLLPTLKVPGVVWSATLVLGLLIAVFGRTRGKVMLVVLATGGATAATVLLLFRNKLVSVNGQAHGEIAQSFFDNLLLFDNWHLLWYLFPVSIALGWRDALRQMRGSSAALLAGFAFLWGVLAFTRAGNWVVDYTTVNRAFLHVAPAALVFGAILFWRWAVQRESAVQPHSAATDEVIATTRGPAT